MEKTIFRKYDEDTGRITSKLIVRTMGLEEVLETYHPKSILLVDKLILKHPSDIPQGVNSWKEKIEELRQRAEKYGAKTGFGMKYLGGDLEVSPDLVLYFSGCRCCFNDVVGHFIDFAYHCNAITALASPTNGTHYTEYILKKVFDGYTRMIKRSREPNSVYDPNKVQSLSSLLHIDIER